jgi:hypothetical protein
MGPLAVGVDRNGVVVDVFEPEGAFEDFVEGDGVVRDGRGYRRCMSPQR